MRAALTIAANELRRRLRDRSALLQGVVAPIGLAVIVGLAFGGGASVRATIGVADADGTPASAAVVDALAGSDDAEDADDGDGDGVAFTATAADEVEGLVADGELDAAIILPEGFAAAATGDGEVPDVVVLTDPEAEIAASIARSVAAGIAGRVDAGRVAAATVAATTDADAAELAAVAVTATSSPPPIALDEASTGTGFDVVTYFAPSMALIFLFLTVGAGARALLSAQEDGILDRVRAAPVRTDAVLAGTTGAITVVGFAALVAVWAVTTLAFGADWGDPAGVLVVIGATVVAIAGISTLVTGLSRTADQADAWSSAVAFVLALLGGNFVPPGGAPPLLQRVSLLTPNGWALRAFTDLSAGEADVLGVLPAAAVLTAMGAAGAVGGSVLLRRRFGP